MALKSTIYKFDFQVNDFNKEHYQQYALNVALHPSEKVERMLIRLIAFGYFANERLLFTKGLSTDEEPDLWQRSLSDEIERWIELGLPDDKRIKKALSQSKEVVIFAYGGQKVAPWLSELAKTKLDLKKLKVYIVEGDELVSLSSDLPRTCQMDCMIQDESVTISVDEQVVSVSVQKADLS